MFSLRSLFIFIGFIIGSLPAVMAWAGQDDLSEQVRLYRMDSEMNCIKQHTQNSISWNDVCYLNDTADNKAYVDSLIQTRGSSNPELTQEHLFDLGPEVSYIRYHEHTLGVRESGMVYGIYGSYNFRPPQEEPWTDFINVYHIDTHVDYSRVDYKGSGDINGVNDFMLEPRAWFGKDFTITYNSRLTPYVGVGYRYLADRSGDKVSSTGDYGYDRRSQYLYVPIGTEIAFIPTPGWEIGLNSEYDVLIRGWQTSYLSQVPTGFAGVQYPNITNIQNTGFGLRGSLDLIKKNDVVNFVISPYIRYWNVKSTKTATVSNEFVEVWGYEPDNTSMEIGLKLGVQF